MGRRLARHIISIVVLMVVSISAKAQFKDDAFSQSYNQTDSTSVSDTTDQLFSFKELFNGLAHKEEMRIGTMFAGSVILPGSAQIYNRQYWKLPVVYGSIGALAGTGGYYLHRYNQSKKTYDKYLTAKNHYESMYGGTAPFEAPLLDTKAKTTGTWLMVGAGLAYWGSLLDGVVNYHPDRHPNAGRATLYSALLPGLGQVYNGELFKVPIYWGCLAGSVHFLMTNNTNYVRFKRIHNEATNPDPNISSQVPIPAETAKWYRDVYRRYRDYSIVATVAFYLLQVIDANVFAYMHDFEVDDQLSINFEPAVIAPNSAYALNMPYSGGQNSVGMRLGITF